MHGNLFVDKISSEKERDPKIAHVNFEEQIITKKVKWGLLCFFIFKYFHTGQPLVKMSNFKFILLVFVKKYLLLFR